MITLDLEISIAVVCQVNQSDFGLFLAFLLLFLLLFDGFERNASLDLVNQIPLASLEYLVGFTFELDFCQDNILYFFLFEPLLELRCGRCFDIREGNFLLLPSTTTIPH